MKGGERRKVERGGRRKVERGGRWKGERGGKRKVEGGGEGEKGKERDYNTVLLTSSGFMYSSRYVLQSLRSQSSVMCPPYIISPNR